MSSFLRAEDYYLYTCHSPPEARVFGVIVRVLFAYSVRLVVACDMKSRIASSMLCISPVFCVVVKKSGPSLDGLHWISTETTGFRRVRHTYTNGGCAMLDLGLISVACRSR